MKKNSTKAVLYAVLALYLVVGVGAVVVFARSLDTKEAEEPVAEESTEVADDTVIERTDDVSAELEEVQAAIDEATEDDTAEDALEEESDADKMDEFETDTDDADTDDEDDEEEIPADATIEVSGEFVGEVIVNVEGGSGINMRSGPGRDYSVVDDYKNGTKLYIIDGDGTGTWIHVTDGENEGYMSARMLNITMY